MTDPHFERAVRGAARRGRFAGEHPDATLLASYVDRSLSADERTQVEAHLADCVECLEHLALLGHVNVPEDVPDPLEGFSIRRLFSGWGWLVPLATAVLVIAIWERHPADNPQPVRTAQTDAASSPPPAQPSAAPVPPAAKEEAGRPAPQSPQGSLAARPTAHPVEAKSKAAEVHLQFQDTRNEAAQKQLAERPPAGDSVDALRERDKKTLDAKDQRTPAAMAESVRQVAGAPAAPNPPGARADDARAQGGAQALNMARPNEQAAGAFLKSAVTTPVVLASGPGLAVRRVGDRLERSVDGGTTWAVDLERAPESLSVGMCPNSVACWIGGTSGIVLVRSASGAWSRRDLGDPSAVIRKIDAADATNAVVTLADGRQFRTTDAGVTWTLVPASPPH
jgi:hypothetical protein